MRFPAPSESPLERKAGASPAGGVASSQVAPGRVGMWAGGQAADSRQFAWAAPADVYSQPGEEGGVIYIPQGDGPQLSPLCLGGQEGRAGAEGAGGLCGGRDCSAGSRSPGGALVPCRPACGGASLPSPLPPASLPPSPPALTSWAAAGQPFALGARAPILQLGSRRCRLPVPPPHALCPHRPRLPSRVLAGHLGEEAGASGRSTWLPLSLAPDEGKLVVSLFTL